jgi:hypothetical protein
VIQELPPAIHGKGDEMRVKFIIDNTTLCHATFIAVFAGIGNRLIGCAENEACSQCLFGPPDSNLPPAHGSSWDGATYEEAFWSSVFFGAIPMNHHPLAASPHRFKNRCYPLPVANRDCESSRCLSRLAPHRFENRCYPLAACAAPTLWRHAPHRFKNRCYPLKNPPILFRASGGRRIFVGLCRAFR